MSNQQHSLPLLLKKLRLPTIHDQWHNKEVEAEKKGWSYSHYLSDLISLELCHREQRRIQRHITEARLPPGKTLDTFDFSKTKSINTPQITTLAEDPTWVKQACNLMIFGPSGVGKTHLAAAIAYRLIEHSIRAFFASTVALVQTLQRAKSEYKLPEALAKLDRFAVIILDDMSYVKKNEAETSVLFELIAHRYETRSLIITSNQSFKEWDQIFPDTTMTVAAVDRLVHHATIINVEEESYRRSFHNATIKGGEKS
ncbi:MAG: IS21-like element helper ATPase IstB [Ignavibacteriaceae bacterium]|nr:IS21-like element helper ATPase IstB [Ignavibacteriaceae bacterium]